MIEHFNEKCSTLTIYYSGKKMKHILVHNLYEWYVIIDNLLDGLCIGRINFYKVINL